MSRALLATALGTGVLAVGFHTAWTACRNTELGGELDRLQRSCEELEALRARLRARVDAHVRGLADTPGAEEAWLEILRWSEADLTRLGWVAPAGERERALQGDPR